MKNTILLKTTFVILMVFMTFSLSVFSQTFSENVIELKIKGVSLFTSYSIVIRQLGKPLQRKQGKSFYSECSESRETTLTLRYSGLVIGLSGDGKGRNFEVHSIEVTSSKWSAASGISVGASLKDVLAKFGQPVRKENESGLQRFYYYHGDGGAAFFFRANKLVKIALGYNSC